jgi:hypothetical protein
MRLPQITAHFQCLKYYQRSAKKLPLNNLAVFLTARAASCTTKQSGNKKYHSTETLSILVNDILLKSRENIGVLNETLSWFESYISDRKQFVRIGSAVSEVLPITHRVSQGAILSPLLFCIYMNDLSRILQSSELEDLRVIFNRRHC